MKLVFRNAALSADESDTNFVPNGTGYLDFTATVTDTTAKLLFQRENAGTGSTGALTITKIVQLGALVALEPENIGQTLWQDASPNGISAAVTGAKVNASGAISPFMFRNRIINGCMRFDQRNVGVAKDMSSAGYGYYLDRWITASGSSTVVTLQQQVAAATSNGYSFKASVKTVAALGTSYIAPYKMPIEGYNVADLDGKTVTLSFLFRTNKAGQYPVGVSYGTYATSRVMTFTHTGDGAWRRYSFTFDLPVGAVTNKTNGIGLNLHIAMACTDATSFQTNAPNTWITSALPKLTALGDTDWWTSTSNYLDLAEVQLEEGSVATPFERRPYGTELGLCQRYFYSTYPTGVAPGSVSSISHVRYLEATCSYATIQYSLPVTMRAQPTFKVYNPVTGTENQLRGDAANFAAQVLGGQAVVSVIASNTSISQHVGISAHITASAEL
jgi:hypothetical protein